MSRRLKLRAELLKEARAAMLRRLVFELEDDGTVSVIEDGAVLEQHHNLANALTTWRIRRTDLVPAG